MTDNRFRRICPLCKEDINSIKKPCPNCAFYDVDFRECRIIRTDYLVQEIYRLLRQPHNC